MAGRHAAPTRAETATPHAGTDVVVPGRRPTPPGGRRATKKPARAPKSSRATARDTPRRPRRPRLRRIALTLVLVAVVAGAVPVVRHVQQERQAAAEAAALARAVTAESERRTRAEDSQLRTSRSLTAAGRAVAERMKILADCDSGGDQPSGPNGRLPASALCAIPGSGIELRADAAEAWASLQEGFKEAFGRYPCVNNGYRSYAQQAKMHAANPGMVAPPGTSNHGLGLALDLCTASDGVAGSSAWDWMDAHAPEYGWALPSWARPGGSRPEPWHWEYVASGDRVS
ncbi:M15 family metallopeptidase [Mumia sp. DW29H23]|uniref:M15 family metallopeptidase n=1 Tax=Mumia sp. DW29H23 TaxID=3421241 RepID=UPI003D69B69B